MPRPTLAAAFSVLLAVAGGAAATTAGYDSIEAFARAIGMKPGGWHTSLKVKAVRVEPRPGGNPAAAAAVKARLESAATRGDEMDDCVHEPAVGKASLPGILLEKGCSFSRMEVAEGRWAVTSQCKIGEGAVVKTVGEGSYAPDLVTGRHVVDFSSADLSSHIELETVTRFTGECPAPVVIRMVPAPRED